MKILITGFDPFGGEKCNPSYEVVKKTDDIIANAAIVKVQVPTIFFESVKIVCKKGSLNTS